MTARPVMGTDGLLTIALGEGANYRVLPRITGFFGIISALFKRLWDQAEMHETINMIARSFYIISAGQCVRRP